jgi:circadian clock protein KaiC
MHFEKSPISTNGFDVITDCGLQQGRKTLYAGVQIHERHLWPLSFWSIKGAKKYDKMGVSIAFEESFEELAQNFAFLGFYFRELGIQEKLIID